MTKTARDEWSTYPLSVLIDNVCIESGSVRYGFVFEPLDSYYAVYRLTDDDHVTFIALAKTKDAAHDWIQKDLVDPYDPFVVVSLD